MSSLSLFSANQSRKKKWAPPPTVTLDLELFKPSRERYPEFNIRQLIREKLGKNDDSSSDENEDFEGRELKKRIQQLEEKYGSKKDKNGKKHKIGKASDYMSYVRSAGYDLEDPFIDDSEPYDELIPSTMDTKRGGFYVNEGRLEFVDREESSSDEEEDGPGTSGTDAGPPQKQRKTIALSDSSDDDLSFQPPNTKVRDDVIDDVIRKSRVTPGTSAAQKKAIQVKRRLSQQVAASKLKHAAGAKTTPAKKVAAASKATVSPIETLLAGLTQGSPNALTEAQKQAIIKQLSPQRPRMVGRPPSLMKARVQHKHTNPTAVDEQLEAFKRKWVRGPSRGCPEQNDNIEQIYELCRVEGMNSHETARVKRALANFLQIQKESLDTRLKQHRKRRENKAAAESDVSNQSLNLSVIEKSAIDPPAPSAPVVNEAPPAPTVAPVPIALPTPSVVAPVAQPATVSPVVQQPTAVSEGLKKFKAKWQDGPAHGCPGQNDEILELYAICKRCQLNSHDLAAIKRDLAAFLKIQKETLDARLKVHKKRKEMNQINSVINSVTPQAQPAPKPPATVPSTQAEKQPQIITPPRVTVAQAPPKTVNAASIQQTPPVPSIFSTPKITVAGAPERHTLPLANPASTASNVTQKTVGPTVSRATVAQELALAAKARAAVALAKSQAAKPTLTNPPTVPNTVTQQPKTTPPRSVDYSNQNQVEILEKLRKALRQYVPFMEHSYEAMVNKWSTDCKLGINKAKPTRKWNWTEELIALVTAAISCCVRMWEGFPDETKRKRPLEMCLMNFCQQNMVPLWNEIAPGWMNEKLLLHATRSVHCKYTDAKINQIWKQGEQASPSKALPASPIASTASLSNEDVRKLLYSAAANMQDTKAQAAVSSGKSQLIADYVKSMTPGQYTQHNAAHPSPVTSPTRARYSSPMSYVSGSSPLMTQASTEAIYGMSYQQQQQQQQLLAEQRQQLMIQQMAQQMYQQQRQQGNSQYGPPYYK